MINKTGIYKIVNKINNHTYYGSAANSFKHRWNGHKHQLNKNKHGNIHLQRAWNKYGANNFEFKIILLCDPNMCLYYEQLFLDKYWDNCVNCYNIYKTAGSPYGIKQSNETRQKKSIANSGSKNPMYGKRFFGQDNPFYGKTHSSEAIQKMKNNQPDNSGEKNPFYGKHHTEESLSKMRGRKMTDESRQKSSKTRKESKVASGENNPSAKLTWILANEIREKYKTGNFTKSGLAKEYGVSRSAVRLLLINKTWRI